MVEICLHPDPTARIVETIFEMAPADYSDLPDVRILTVVRLCPICHKAYLQEYSFDAAEHYHFCSLI